MQAPLPPDFFQWMHRVCALTRTTEDASEERLINQRWQLSELVIVHASCARPRIAKPTRLALGLRVLMSWAHNSDCAAVQKKLTRRHVARKLICEEFSAM